MNCSIAIFGEAERGKFSYPYEIKYLADLAKRLGHPPKNSLGLFFAIQTLLYKQKLLFFRVKEEGFSTKDYLKGFHYLKNPDKVFKLTAIGLPNVGDHMIINATYPLCVLHKSMLIITEKDLYDYLTW